MTHIPSSIRTIAAAAGIALLTGCTTNPFTGERQASKAGTGAAIGAAAGAAVGAISGDDKRERTKRALIGAGVGALAGAAVGHYMDLQEAKLRRQLEGSGVSVTRVGNDIILNMPGNVTFATNSADINSGFYNVLDSVALVVNEFDKTVIEIGGHTDSRGSEAYNQGLSERRAASVSEYIKSREVSRLRILISGFGESRPIASNDTPEGRAQNRRVELTLVPLT